MRIAKKRHRAGQFTCHVKRGDTVLVLAGRSIGEKGRVTSVDPQRERALVEGVNLVTKHQRAQGSPNSPAAQQQAGRIERPSPIHISNLMVVCTNEACNKPTRPHRHYDESQQRWVRDCRHCGEILDKSEA